jgi:hypothetical protein
MIQARSSKDASEALSYFNHSHDAFLESMLVNVIPENPEGFGFAIPVRHDVTLGRVHSNYPAAEADGDRKGRVELRLARVTRMLVGGMAAVDDMLQECIIAVDADGAVHLDVGGDGLITFGCDSLTIEELRASRQP